MLVINGVDAQTNSHTTGVTHNWSGRNAIGYPTLSALFAAKNAPDQPLSYINFGGFGDTANLIRFSRIANLDTLRGLLSPESARIEGTFRRPEDVARVRRYRQARMARLAEDSSLLPQQARNLESFSSALKNKSSLSEFAAFLPSASEVLPDVAINNLTTSTLLRQVQTAAAAFDSGLASSVDLWTTGYDTHKAHDGTHEVLFNHLNDAIDLLWTLAEEKGFADRLTVLVSSDFGRTPHYNSDDGKDHWPIGSVVVMRRNASWTNRAVGGTDEIQNAYQFNPATLERDDNNGVTILPEHVHLAMRKLVGVHGTTVDFDFPFPTTETFDFFE